MVVVLFKFVVAQLRKVEMKARLQNNVFWWMGRYVMTSLSGVAAVLSARDTDVFCRERTKSGAIHQPATQGRQDYRLTHNHYLPSSTSLQYNVLQGIDHDHMPTVVL